MEIEIIITFLEMKSPEDLRARLLDRDDLAVARVPAPFPELSRFFYTAVGGDRYWMERLPWTYARWLEYLGRPELQTWAFSVGGVPAGYSEVEAQPLGDVEIVKFGLVPAFIGQGLGAHFLSELLRRVWGRESTQRIWLHTCTLDHPHALANYEARGFTRFRRQAVRKQFPEQSPGPWPGAGPR